MYKIFFLILFTPLVSFSQTIDPTRPLNTLSSASGKQVPYQSQGLQLSSILYSEARRVVVINGHALSENQKVAGVGFVVKKITPDSAVVLQNDKIFTLKLNVHDVKKFESVGNESTLMESSKK